VQKSAKKYNQGKNRVKFTSQESERYETNLYNKYNSHVLRIIGFHHTKKGFATKSDPRSIHQLIRHQPEYVIIYRWFINYLHLFTRLGRHLCHALDVQPA